MARISAEVARIYPEKYQIRFDELKETKKDTGYVLVGGHQLSYTLNDTRLSINSGLLNRDDESVYFMEACLTPDSLLDVGLVTWEESMGYFPPFYAHGFLNMVLEHFSGQYNGIKAEWYNDPGRSQIYEEFFKKYDRKKSPEKVAMNTKTGKWLVDAGFSKVVPDKRNIYNPVLSSALYFVFYK